MRNKKILSLFMLMLGVFLIFSSSVLADKKDNQVGVDYADSRNWLEIKKNIGTASGDIKTHVKMEDSGEILYCADREKGNPSVEDKGYVLWNCDNTVSKNKEELLYILNNGLIKFPASFGTDEQEKYFVKQMAVWYFTRPGDSLFSGFDPNSTSYSISRKIQNMIDDATAYKNKKPVVTLTVEGNKTMNLTSDGKYYISNKITIGSTDLSDDNISVTVSGATGVFVTSDANATSGATSFKSGSKVYVKVPVASITKNSNITLSVTGKYIEYLGDIYDCTPVNTSANIQNVLHYEPKQISNKVSSSISLNVSLKDVVISKQDITGSKEIEGATLVVKRNNVPVATWISTSTPKTLSLAPGTYTLEETIAPKGYIKSTSKITFVVKEDGTITVDDKKVDSVVMKNEPIVVYISKKSINGKTELPGAKLKITDKDGKIVKDVDGKELEWISTTKEVSFHLAAGTYYLTETVAPEGYELSDTTIEFTVTEDGKVKMDKKDVDGNLVVFTNTPEPTPVKTGSFMIYIVVIGILSVGLVTYYVIKKQIV